MGKATARDVLKELKSLGNAAQAAILRRFFKTGPGEYGEGDVFLGIKVPVIRGVAKRFRDLPLVEVRRLLRSKEHEARVAALEIATIQFKAGDAELRDAIYRLYLANTRWINNWDLVDLSAPSIVGAYLYGQDTSSLDRLASSCSLWERRIAVVATHWFIRNKQFGPTLRIARALLGDEHDLIHKAVGWMLREVGKRDREVEERFLRRHCRRMPRTMLRYAIERFEPGCRAAYLRGKPLGPQMGCH